MLNESNISTVQVDELNDFTSLCEENRDTIRNGNSLKMEIELELYDEAGEAEFIDNIDFINSEISIILDNIRIEN